VVLTGHNTDIDFGGVTYHVQTEDKGQENPLIETLVYAKGEILYSRRTPYQELIAQGVDSKAVMSLMDRQHQTVVEAIRRGRLDELWKAPAGAAATDSTAVSDGGDAAREAPHREPTKSLDEVILEYLDAQKHEAHLVLRSQGPEDFVYGEVVALRVVAVNSQNQEPVPGVQISVLFKSTAEPRRLLLAEGMTDQRGLFQAEAPIPPFNGGTSAVVVTGQGPLGQTEIKHLVHR